MKRHLLLFLLLPFALLIGQSGNALQFTASSGQYVTCAYKSAMDIPNGGALTIEAWVYPTSSTVNVVTRDNYGWGLIILSGKLVFWDQSVAASAPTSTGSVTLNKWQHIAVTVSDVGSSLSVNFYINGVADAGNPRTSSQTSIGNGSASATMDIGIQAKSSCACNYFNGYMDELRIWTVARTATEIKNNYLNEVSASSTGLMAYYKFNEGTGTTLTDQTSNAINGTLTNSPGWVVSTANIASSGAGNCLSFDGTNDYVSVPSASQYAFGTSTDYTLEAWVKFSASQSNYTGIVVKGTTPAAWQGYQLLLYGNKIASEIKDGTNQVGIAEGLVGTTALNDGNWHHLALVVTRSSTNAKLYVDGNQEASVTNAFLGNSVTNSSNMLIGTERTNALYLNGYIDEVRVWNVARTQTQLQTYRTQGLDPSTSGLVAYFRFDAANSSSTNTSATNLIDLTSYANNGTLTNFALSGSSSNWVLANNASLPVELNSFTAAVSSGFVTLNWSTQTEVNNSGFEVERSSDGKSWAKLSFIKGAGTSNVARNYSYQDKTPMTGKSYYRLKQIDNDGTVHFLQSEEVTFNAPVAFALEQNHPNPFNPTTVINFSLPEAGNITLKVYNILGKEVMTIADGYYSPGKHSVTLNAATLASGVYLYRLNNGNNSLTKRLVVSK